MNMPKKVAAILAAVMTAAVLLLRVTLTPLMQDSDTGVFHLSYIVIAVMTVSVIAFFVLTLIGKKGVGGVARPLVTPVAMVCVAAGAVLVLSSLYDVFNWVTLHRTPPPNATVTGKADAIFLILTIVFGVLGGVFLIRAGFAWSARHKSARGLSPLWALAPTLWIWMRLARYEMSYASAIDVSQSFYDFVMLIFTLLFLFAFARYVSGIDGGKKPRMILPYALCTALFSLSGTLTRLVMYNLQDSMAYTASELAGFADFGIGLFALIFAFSLAFSREKLEPSPYEEGEEEAVTAYPGAVVAAEEQPEEPEAGPSLRNSPIAAPVEADVDTGADDAAAADDDASNVDASNIDALIDQFKSGRDGDSND